MFACDFFSVFSQTRGPFWIIKSAGAVSPWPHLKPPLITVDYAAPRFHWLATPDLDASKCLRFHTKKH